MRCPTGCDAVLVMTERSGVEIDYCPDCRGVWLDRGELDKLVERGGPPSPPPRDDRDDRPRPEAAPRKKRRTDIFQDLFEF